MDLTEAVDLGAYRDGTTGVKIRGTIAGHHVTVFAVDYDRLHALLPPDMGQPYFKRGRTITLSELETHLAGMRLEPPTASAHEVTEELVPRNYEAGSVEQDQTDGTPVSKPVPAWRDTWPAETTGFDEQLAAALAVFPTPVAPAIQASDAFGALAYKVHRRGLDTGETPAQVLDAISADDRAFAQHADDPAAFLASRIDS